MSDFEIYILLLFLMGYLIGRYKRKRLLTENIGETDVRNTLSAYCKNRDAHFLNNITLRLEDGSTTQVDHVLITKKGIFVIETKHFKGWIFGNPKSKFWTQVLFKRKFRFQNPILQNYRHVVAIQKHLDFVDPKIIQSLVVFTGDAILKTNLPENVCYLENFISKIEQQTVDTISLNHVQYCVGRLEYLRLALTQETDIEHQANLQQRFKFQHNR